MRLFAPRAGRLAVLTLALGFASPAFADTIKVLAAGAVKGAVTKLIPAFEAKTGHKVVAEYDTVGALRDRVLKGEKVDVVLLSAQAIAAIGAATPAAATLTIGKTGVGLGVPAGRPKPPMATTADFIAALRAAKSISYADPARGATAGQHFRTVLTKLGVADELAPKIKLAHSGIESIDAVEKGEVELGSSQVTEILGHPGVDFAGMLPEDIQLWTVYRLARFSTGEGAGAFVAAMVSPEAQAIFKSIGFQPE